MPDIVRDHPGGGRHELEAGPGARGLPAHLDPAGPAGRAAIARGDVDVASSWRAAADDSSHPAHAVGRVGGSLAVLPCSDGPPAEDRALPPSPAWCPTSDTRQNRQMFPNAGSVNAGTATRHRLSD